MGRWIGWFVIALCGMAHSQNTDDDSSQKILRALRNLNKAQVLYQIYGGGFACRLEQLGPPRNGAKSSAQAAGLISEELASGQFAGYELSVNCTPDDYQVTAVPVAGAAGAVWCVDKSMVLRTSNSVDSCLTEGTVPLRPKRAGSDQFSKTAPDEGQETQARGYWVNSWDGLMWAAKDSEKRGGWHQAVRYCRKLRLAGYSDWRLATIDELEGLVNLPAYATEYEGGSDILHRNADLKVSGGLLLTYGRQWSSTPVLDLNGHPLGHAFWSFWFDEGRRWKGFDDPLEGDTMDALCVRDAVPRP